MANCVPRRNRHDRICVTTRDIHHTTSLPFANSILRHSPPKFRVIWSIIAHQVKPAKSPDCINQVSIQTKRPDFLPELTNTEILNIPANEMLHQTRSVFTMAYTLANARNLMRNDLFAAGFSQTSKAINTNRLHATCPTSS